MNSGATSAAVSSQHNRVDDRDAIAKCESGFGTTLRGAVWGAEWMAYGAKYALVQSYGLLDKTVATGGCRHEVSPGELNCSPSHNCTNGLMAYNCAKQPADGTGVSFSSVHDQANAWVHTLVRTG